MTWNPLNWIEAWALRRSRRRAQAARSKVIARTIVDRCAKLKAYELRQIVKLKRLDGHRLAADELAAVEYIAAHHSVIEALVKTSRKK